MDGCVVRLHTVAFKPQMQGSRSDFTAQPIRVQFHELLNTNDAQELLPQVDNRDVLRAIVVLFDLSLPNVGSRDVHDTAHCRGANTIILLRQHTDVLEEYRSRTPPSTWRDHLSPPPPKVVPGDSDSEGQFSTFFSESEESSEESSDENSAEATNQRSLWESFCRGQEEFLVKARERRALREAAAQDGEILPSAVGVESLIVAAATYELKTLATGEKVLQLSLLATRKCYRNCGVGRYIIELLKTQSVCGAYDALLAHADSDAVDFFALCGLIDDPLLNDKFREVRDEWTNTTLMSYLPPFTTEAESRNTGVSLSLPELELEVELARTKALSAYQQQAVCVTRLVREVKTLREQLELQKEEVENLNYELERERERRHKIEQMFLEYKLRKTRQLLERHVIDSDDQDQNDPPSFPHSPTDLLDSGENRREDNAGRKNQSNTGRLH